MNKKIAYVILLVLTVSTSSVLFGKNFNQCPDTEKAVTIERLDSKGEMMDDQSYRLLEGPYGDDFI